MRALTMAMAAFCLVCIGVHAGADRIDDLLMTGIERIDIAVDALVGSWAVTRPLAELIDSELIVKLSRSAALVWELAASIMLVGAVLSLEQRAPLDFKKAARRALRPFQAFAIGSAASWIHILRVALRPLCTGAFVLAGSSAVGRTLYGSVMLNTRHALGARAASLLGRAMGVCALLVTLTLLGIPAIAASAVNASQMGPLLTTNSGKGWRELLVLAMVLPLAWFAVQSGWQLGGLFA